MRKGRWTTVALAVVLAVGDLPTSALYGVKRLSFRVSNIEESVSEAPSGCFALTSGSIPRRRAVMSASALAASGPALASDATVSSSLGYRDTTVSVGGEQIPVAMWFPVAEDQVAEAAVEEPYSYRISVAKIFKMLLGVTLPAFLASTFRLRSSYRLFPKAAPPAALEKSQQLPVVVFAHGYLGSRFDMLHLAEYLASRGFVVAAPEFAESLSASFEASEATPRKDIMAATLRMLDEEVGIDSCGLIGHSAGAGTIADAAGSFNLGRVVVAGGVRNYQKDDPLLVVASQGDGLFRRRWQEFSSNLAAIGVDDKVTFLGDDGAKSLALLSDEQMPQRSALLWRQRADGSAGVVKPVPNHISFLGPQSNQAMVDFLSPLLPLARLLGVPVLDFDVYQENPDSEPTAAMVIPAVTRFFESRLEKRPELEAAAAAVSAV
eukprot:TRINITY_DN59773_c0_g1_i1.p1 TRINITY_DN59773_c0_g1~~TRINITY_DN59773_c0_g1_i1.p1  ORF type:complete len:435 (+),score=108.59 TRINITY_DN59773_c0_g1_i1:100-1404(+)